MDHSTADEVSEQLALEEGEEGERISASCGQMEEECNYMPKLAPGTTRSWKQMTAQALASSGRLWRDPFL